MTVAAIILAAGQGERIKFLGDKPFLKVKGKLFIEIIIEKLSEVGFQKKIIVTNKKLFNKIVSLDLAADVLLNPRPQDGMLSSLHCGLNHLDDSTTGFLLHPVDFVLVQPATYRQLLELHGKHPECIIQPQFADKSGHPVIFPKSLFDEIKKAPLHIGARYVMMKYPHFIKRFQTTDMGIVININTPAIYFKYCLQD